jgi:3-oxoacyl-[acyl-carrier-protein] synthase III
LKGQFQWQLSIGLPTRFVLSIFKLIAVNKMNAVITAVAGYVPDYILTNQELSTMVETSDEWIMTRVGIKERHILKGEGLGSSDMGAKAVQRLLEKSGTKPEEIDLIICATATPDHQFPATANIISDKVNIRNAQGFDINAACSGFIYALDVATQFVRSGSKKKVIVVGADKMSSITDYTDRTTCVLFGDASAAVLLEPTTEELGVMDTSLHSDGFGRPHLHMKAGGSVKPASHDTIDAREHFIYQEGQMVFKHAVSKMADTAADIMERNNLKSEDIAWLVPHQANLRIIDATGNRMGLPKEKVMINIERYGNTTTATIPLCLWEWEKQLKKGDNLILAAFGAGFTWGAVYLKWGYDSK